MEKLLARFTAGALKAIIIIGFGLYAGLAEAQSITGKWKMTSAKETVTDKATGKTEELTAEPGDITEMIEHVLELNTDSTYLLSSTLVGSNIGITGSGTYNILE